MEERLMCLKPVILAHIHSINYWYGYNNKFHYSYLPKKEIMRAKRNVGLVICVPKIRSIWNTETYTDLIENTRNPSVENRKITHEFGAIAQSSLCSFFTRHCVSKC